MALKNKSTLNSDIDTQLADNNSENITPSILRGVLKDMVDSDNNPQEATTEEFTSSDKTTLGDIIASQFYDFAESDGNTQEASTTLLLKVALNLVALPAGDYRWTWSAEIAQTTTGRDAIVEFRVNTTVNNNPAMQFSTTNDYISVGGFRKFTHAGGNLDLEIFFARASGGGGGGIMAQIRRARVEIRAI